MKLLLTGGAGYVGSACLRWLLRHGHEPVAFDNLSAGNRAAVPKGRLVVGDVENRTALKKVIREHKVEAVMHFAALASVPESLKDPERYWRVNVIGTKNVLDAMRSCGVHKLLFSSTAATYSPDSPMSVTESSEVRPQTPYGTTKLAGEWMIREYARTYGIGYTVLRYFNASGADPDGEFGEDRRQESHLIPSILKVATGRRKTATVFGDDFDTPDGTCVRDYVHTDDLALAHQLAVEAIEPGTGRLYNVGSGSGTSVLEVLRACEDAVGREIPHEVRKRRPGDPGILIANPGRIFRELGWQPRYPHVHAIVATAWNWSSRYPQGYASKPPGAGFPSGGCASHCGQREQGEGGFSTQERSGS